MAVAKTASAHHETAASLEKRLTRAEADIERVNERVATALQSFSASIATLQQTHLRQDGKLDHIVELQNEAKNTTGAIERIFRLIADTTVEHKTWREQHKVETEQRWEMHRRELVAQCLRDETAMTARQSQYEIWRGAMDREVAAQSRRISNWAFGGTVVGILFTVIIFPFALWTYNRDQGVNLAERDSIRATIDADNLARISDNRDTRAMVQSNSDKLRATEIYLAKDPLYKPAGVTR